MRKEVVIGIKLVLWFIICINFLNLGFEMLSAPNTIENVIGFLIIVATFVVGVETKCLTNLNFKRKHEK